VIKSRGGLGKTFLVENSLTDNITFKGHSTPLSIYIRLSKNPTKKVVFDDVDSLLSNKTNVALLKQICETNQIKTIRYDTTVKTSNEFPEEFKSQNKVIMLCNDIKRMGHNMKALLTRGIYVDFKPSNEEVLAVLREFAKDKEILSYLNTHHLELNDLNFRLYKKALELKNSGLDWEEYLESENNLNTNMDIVREIFHLPTRERNSIWLREGVGSIRKLQRLIRKHKRDIELNDKRHDKTKMCTKHTMEDVNNEKDIPNIN